MSLRQFLTDPHYVGHVNIWPNTLHTLLDIEAKQPQEIVLPWAIGSGKSMVGALYLAWLAYQHLPAIADGSFFERYGLEGNKPAFMFVLATRAEQARDNIFRELQGAIGNSPWFTENYEPADYKHRIVFTEGDRELPLVIQPLGASPRAPLAADCFAYAIDEAGWWVESEGKLGDSAEEINNTIRTRMVSRFLHAGVLLNLSAPRYTGDFVQRRAREIERNGDAKCYCSRRTVWDCKPELVAEIEAGDGMEVPHPETGQPVLIPSSLLAEFEANPELSWRDFGGVPSQALQAFDSTAVRCLERCGTLDDLPPPNPAYTYFVHCDLALTSDQAALALVHCEPDGEEEARVVLDRVEILDKAPDTGAVELEAARQRILHWSAQGFGIRQCSADQYQSADLLQRLHRDGFETAQVSVDKTLEAYNALKVVIHEVRFRYCPGMKYAHSWRDGEGREHPGFAEEYCGLELVRGVKVDHGPGRSKDIADAVAGGVWQATLLDELSVPLTELVQF